MSRSTDTTAVAAAIDEVLEGPDRLHDAVDAAGAGDSQADTTAQQLLRELLLALHEPVSLSSDGSPVVLLLRDAARERGLTELLGLVRRVIKAHRSIVKEVVALVAGAGIDAGWVRDLAEENACHVLELAALIHDGLDDADASVAQDRLRMSLLTILSGLPPTEAAAAMRRLGMNPDAQHWVWALRPRGELSEFIRKVIREALGPPHAVFTKFDELLVGISCTHTPFVAAGMNGGVDGPVVLADVAKAFERANVARMTGEAFRFEGVHSMEELGLLPHILSNPTAGEGLITRYVEPLIAAGPLAADLLTTVRAYLVHQHRRHEVAEVMHLHANTVSYRLTRFVHFTHAELDDHRTQAELWWLFRYLAIRDELSASGAGSAMTGRQDSSPTALDALLRDVAKGLATTSDVRAL